MDKLKISLFILFIFSFGIWHLLKEDLLFSDRENRVLQALPTISFENIRTGKWMATFETYVADQFPLRNEWVGLKAVTEKSVGKKENNGILFGKDDYLFEPFVMNDEQATVNMAAVNEFVRKVEADSVGFMLAPTSITAYPEKMPRFMEALGERAAIHQLYAELDGRAEKLPVTELLLKQKEESIYFRTDHHWTMLGAYEGYVRAGDVFGFEPLGREDFVREKVSDDFYGSFASRGHGAFVAPDVMEYLRPLDERDVLVRSSDGSVMDSLVWEEALDSEDQYRYFLGGNDSLVVVESDAGSGRKLLVVKDSYAHVLVPFFVHHYDEIHMVDLRYFRDNLLDYAAEFGFDDVLLMYNIGNFVDDVTIRRIAY